MPHRSDVEAAADPEAPGLVGQIDGHHEDVRDAFVTFWLEVVLGEPERVVAPVVEHAREGARLLQGRGQVFVGKAASIHGGAAVPDVVHVDVTGVQAVEFRDHRALRSRPGACSQVEVEYIAALTESRILRTS